MDLEKGRGCCRGWNWSVRVLFADVVTDDGYGQQNRKSTQIYANRSPIHPRLAPLKSRGAGGLLGCFFFIRLFVTTAPNSGCGVATSARSRPRWPILNKAIRGSAKPRRAVPSERRVLGSQCTPWCAWAVPKLQQPKTNERPRFRVSGTDRRE